MFCDADGGHVATHDAIVVFCDANGGQITKHRAYNSLCSVMQMVVK